MSDKRLLTKKDLPWLYDFTVTEGNIFSVLEAQDAKTAEIVRAEERERTMEVIENISSLGYPYGGDYKHAILEALKERMPE